MNEHKRLCSKATSRKALAAQIEAVARECGAACAERNLGIAKSRSIDLRLRKGPWCCMIDLDGDSRVGAFLGHWYHDGEGPETLPAHFDLTIRGSENPYHRRKATSCCYTFEAFLESLRAGLMALPAESLQPA